ncbi:MAG: DUF2089 family protein [Acidobacteriota bacterium]|nr:DUF2089 family protein [Acidobacteriota bacterium]MDE2962700.1 DUF2089 family protein [Acidobacteriota bacterium]
MSPMQGQLPKSCPSCGAGLRVAQLACPACETLVSGNYPLPALARLSGDDQQFVLSFILSSGSLKQMAKLYGVSYPTVRNRLDDLISLLKDVKEASKGREETDGE